MTIEIQASDGKIYEIELESNGDANDNGEEFYYFGETEDSNGETIKIEAFQHRNHPTVSSEDIIVSSNIKTSLDSIADQINENC
jgi:hypothetical protein